MAPQTPSVQLVASRLERFQIPRNQHKQLGILVLSYFLDTNRYPLRLQTLYRPGSNYSIVKLFNADAYPRRTTSLLELDLKVLAGLPEKLMLHNKRKQA